MSSRLFDNILSGFTVFLIALPLSIGIAIASGAPPSAGLLSAIVGGMLGAWLSGSALTINGPAAGLIVVVLSSIQTLGGGDSVTGFKRMLAATVVAGIIQVLFGVFRLGKYCMSVPTSVLHGMMAAIGVSIFLKQIHVVFGVTPVSKGMIDLFFEIPRSFQLFNPEVLLIGTFGFGVILWFERLNPRFTKYFPAPLAVVLGGILFSRVLDFEHEHLVAAHHMTLSSGPKLLLSIPDHLSALFSAPDFSVWNTMPFVHSVMTIALVASIESLLSAVAVDHVDPQKRVSDLNRELWAKGICNSILGWVGGLPIIAEIVRSTANIRNGATDRSSNFFHGLFLAIFICFFPTILHQIPLAALAAILISVGLRLAQPAQVLHLAHIGKVHALAFLVTLMVTLYTDLLIGVSCGFLIEVIGAIFHGTKVVSLFRAKLETIEHPDHIELKVFSPVIFLNWASVMSRIEKTERKKKIRLNFSESHLIDYSTLEQIERLRNRGYTIDHLEVMFSQEHQPISSHPLSSKKKRRTA